MQIVYLDQNKWIELARSAYGLNPDVELADTLTFLREARDRRLATFPLSFGHYMETQRHSNLQRRSRLADFMRDLSGGMTICSFDALLGSEIDNALWQLFPDTIDARRIRSLNLLGKGYSHASGQPSMSASTKSLLDELPASIGRAFEEMKERSLLSGISPWYVVRYDDGDPTAPSEKRFSQQLGLLHSAVALLPEVKRERVLFLIAFLDIFDEIRKSHKSLGLHGSYLANASEDQLITFVNAIPSRVADMHVRREWTRNTQLKAKRSDLVDWGQTVPMVMYSNVVVTEKLLADLINRPGLRMKAKVVTELKALPAILAAGQ